mmetsp:Transcript_37849/g.99116  ORF Transcript_37849/g.99116 Transcript_37849/m.99116 type:complete len:266 (+) Transcript_37849:106-903(+)
MRWIFVVAAHAEDCWVGSLVGWQDACCAEQPELNCFPDDHPKLKKFSVEACCPGGVRQGSGAIPRMEVVATEAVDKSDSYVLVESCRGHGVSRTELSANAIREAYEVTMRPQRLRRDLKIFVYPQVLGIGGCAASITGAVRDRYINATDVWALFVLEAVEFMEAMHDTIMRLEGLVDDPRDADVYYVPVNFLLMLNEVQFDFIPAAGFGCRYWNSSLCIGQIASSQRLSICGQHSHLLRGMLGSTIFLLLPACSQCTTTTCSRPI